jgi:sugar phosphate permease
MMTHNAVTAMGRWCSAQRGRAVSVAAVGQNSGEAVVPAQFVATGAARGWRGAWRLAARGVVVVARRAMGLLRGVPGSRSPRS